MGIFKQKFKNRPYEGSRYVETKDNANPYYDTDKAPVFTYNIKNQLEFDTIRVPSLKRKSAWKRFYKKYPGLKGENVFHGNSRIRAFDEATGRKIELNESFIKLKKV